MKAIDLSPLSGPAEGGTLLTITHTDAGAVYYLDNLMIDCDDAGSQVMAKS